jgi:5-formyltetrahydrofolate cyclo-ligase
LPGFFVTVAPSTKQTLREQALLRRMQIPHDERERATRAITDHFIAHLNIRHDSVIAGYWPIKGEADVLPLLAELARRGHRAALPQVVESRKPLVFRAWHQGAPMTEGRYGIHEPDPAHCDSLVPDVIIVPMLAFDGRGNRLGYGSGFYDRTFQSLRDLHHFFAAGVAYEAQKLDEVPTGPYDYRMDMIVTEKTVRKFERHL